MPGKAGAGAKLGDAQLGRPGSCPFHAISKFNMGLCCLDLDNRGSQLPRPNGTIGQPPSPLFSSLILQNSGINKLSSPFPRFRLVVAAMDVTTESSRYKRSHRPGTVGIPGYQPQTFPVATNAARCGDGHGNAIVLPEGVHSMEDKKGVLHFFDLSGDAWQDNETTAFDCRQGRPEVDDLLNGLFPYVTSHVYGSGSDKDSFIRGHPNYGTNEKHPSGVPTGKYQELMHSVLYERALRQSQYAVIQTMRQQLEDYRRQVKNMRDEMVIKRDACRSLG